MIQCDILYDFRNNPIDMRFSQVSPANRRFEFPIVDKPSLQTNVPTVLTNNQCVLFIPSLYKNLSSECRDTLKDTETRPYLIRKKEEKKIRKKIEENVPGFYNYNCL